MATISLSSHWDHPLARFHYLAPHEVAQIHAAARVSEESLRHVRTEAIQIEDWEGGRWKVNSFSAFHRIFVGFVDSS